ncbi:signal peptidase I [Lentzea sp. NBRC 105346]|uniref:signal peptidase I n=1 Tax=Lentzea sp. NBRC 105346 TaxID=3032205 RepID=UPI0025538005|nr:signal peptidase I [Lentzea sp. NBRC 105346]
MGWVLTGAVVALLIATLILMARGYRMVAVTSGSMRPTYDVGDGVLIRPGDDEPIRVGDVVIFSAGENMVPTIHRVVGVQDVFERGLHYRTKGDANAEPDPQLLKPDAVQAKAYGVVPYAGHVFGALSSTTGRLVLIGFLLLCVGREIVIIVQVNRRRRRRAAALAAKTLVAEPDQDIPVPAPRADTPSRKPVS